MNDRDDAFSGPGTMAATPLPVFSGSRRMPGAVVPRGLAIDFRGDAFSIRVCAEDGSPALEFGPYDDDDVIALWRRLAATAGLPLLLPGPDGALEDAYPQLGRLVVGRRCERRRLAVLTGRRPRFLVKRRASRLPRRPRVHREIEIAAGRADGG